MWLSITHKADDTLFTSGGGCGSGASRDFFLLPLPVSLTPLAASLPSFDGS